MAVEMKNNNEGALEPLSFKGVVERVHKKLIVFTALLSLLLTAGVAGTFSSSNCRVTLQVDGVVRPVQGWMSTVSDVLQQADVRLNPYDIVTPDLDTPVKDGQTITVQSAHSVYVRDGEERKEMWVVSGSIFDAVQSIKGADRDLALIVERSGLQQLPIATHQVKVTVHHGKQEFEETVAAGTSLKKLFERNEIHIGPLDEVTAQSLAPGHLLITVERIGRKIVTEKTDLDFQKKTNKTSDLFIGDEQVKTKGEKGIKETTYAVHTRNDEEIKKVKLSSTVTKEPVDEVVEVGTKNQPAGSASYNLAPSKPTAPANPSEVQKYAQSMLPKYGMDDSEFGCLVDLFHRESGWRWNATNSSSGAYGIPQALPGSKMASAGSDWQTNPKTQVRWGLSYIKSRYGTPCNALNIQRSRGWY